MTMTKIQKDPMQKFMTEFWDFQKKYWNPSDDSEYWDSLMSESAKLIERNKSKDEHTNEYLQSLVISFVTSRDKVA